MRMLALINGGLFVVLPFAAHAQATTSQHLAFEVATVKPSTADQQPSVNFTLGAGDNYTDTGGRFDTRGISLLDHIRFAYKLSDGQVEILRSKAPEWISTERFDVAAKSSIAHPTKDTMRDMMRSLLMERFSLQIHKETRTLSVLTLVQVTPGTTGSLLHSHPASDTSCVQIPPDPSRPSVGAIPNLCGGIRSTGVPSVASRVRLSGSVVSMTSLAAQLGQMGGFSRPIVDDTGLSGTYDFTLEWGPESVAEPTDETSREAYLQEALRKQLGLKLERHTAPFEVILIDHIDRQPSQN